MKKSSHINFQFNPTWADWLALVLLTSSTFWMIITFYTPPDGHAIGAAILGSMIMSVVCLVADYRTINKFSIIELVFTEIAFVGLHGLAAVIYAQLGHGDFEDLFLLNFDRLLGSGRISLLFFAPSLAVLGVFVALIKRFAWALLSTGIGD